MTTICKTHYKINLLFPSIIITYISTCNIIHTLSTIVSLSIPSLSISYVRNLSSALLPSLSPLHKPDIQQSRYVHGFLHIKQCYYKFNDMTL